MKKRIFIYILAIVCLFGLCGCQSDNTNEEYESRIIALEDALSEYEYNYGEMEKKVEKLENSLKNAQDMNKELNNNIASLNKEVETLKAKAVKNINVFLADQYYLVVGDTFQLFYRSVIQAVNPYGYYIKVTGDTGHSFNRYYEFTPTEAGTFDLTIAVCDDNGNEFGKDSTKLIVSENRKTSTKNVLCIGDSLTASGRWVSVGFNKYESSGGKVNSIGTMSKFYKTNTYLYEGRSGWSWNNYLTKFNDVDSPFKYMSTIDFARYTKNNNLKPIEEAYIMMTFNGLPGKFKEFSFDDDFIKNAKQLIDKLHKDCPECKISLMGIPLTSTYAGLGNYYTIEKDYGDNYGKAVTIYNYDNFLEEWCKMDEYKEFMRYIDVKAQFDSEYNMPYEQKAVNVNNKDVTEPVGTNMGLHPSDNGYDQIGYAFYRALMSDWGK